VLEHPRPLLADDPDSRVGFGQLELDLMPDPDCAYDDEDVAQQHQRVGNRDPPLEMLLLAGDVVALLPGLGPELQDQPEEDALCQDEPEPHQHGDQQDDPVDGRRVRRCLLNQTLDHGRSGSARIKE
jgi:hypothetical protein